MPALHRSFPLLFAGFVPARRDLRRKSPAPGARAALVLPESWFAAPRAGILPA